MKWIIIRKLERKGIGVTGGGTHRETPRYAISRKRTLLIGGQETIFLHVEGIVFMHTKRGELAVREICA